MQGTVVPPHVSPSDRKGPLGASEAPKPGTSGAPKVPPGVSEAPKVPPGVSEAQKIPPGASGTPKASPGGPGARKTLRGIRRGRKTPRGASRARKSPRTASRARKTPPRGHINSMQLSYDRLAKHPCTVRRRWGTMLANLVKTTHFDWEELESLCYVFHALTSGSRGKMSRKTFIEVMHAALDMTNTGNVDYSYKNFDPNNNSYISMEHWCRGLSVVLRGTPEEKMAYCFETYDRNREESLKRKHMLWMLPENWCVAQDLDVQVELEELLEAMLSKMPSDIDKGVTLRDYSWAVERQPILMQFLGEVLPSRDMVRAFTASFCPLFPTYEFLPENRTDVLEGPRPPPMSSPTPSRTLPPQQQPTASLYRKPFDGKLIIPTGCRRGSI